MPPRSSKPPRSGRRNKTRAMHLQRLCTGRHPLASRISLCISTSRKCMNWTETDCFPVPIRRSWKNPSRTPRQRSRQSRHRTSMVVTTEPFLDPIEVLFLDQAWFSRQARQIATMSAVVQVSRTPASDDLAAQCGPASGHCQSRRRYIPRAVARPLVWRSIGASFDFIPRHQ